MLFTGPHLLYVVSALAPHVRDAIAGQLAGQSSKQREQAGSTDETFLSAGVGIATDLLGEMGRTLLADLFAEQIHETSEHREAHERFERWLKAGDTAERAPLLSAVSRSAALADLLCLIAAEPGPPEGAEKFPAFRALARRLEQFRPHDFTGGFFPEADRLWMTNAKRDCVLRLRDADSHPVEFRIEFDRLNGDAAAELARARLAAWQGAPDRIVAIFRDRWAGYLMAAFFEERANNNYVRAAFDVLLGEKLDRIEVTVNRIDESNIRIEATVNRIESAVQRSAEAPHRASGLPSVPDPGEVIGRETEIAEATRLLLANRRHPLLVWGPPGIGKSTIALSVLHEPEVRERFGPRRFHARCDEYSTVASLVAGLDEKWFGRVAPDPRGALLGSLADDPCVVLLDNFETPWRPDRARAEVFLSDLMGIPDLWLAIAVQGHEKPGDFAFARIEPPPLDRDRSLKLFRAFAEISDAAAIDPVFVRLTGAMQGVPHAIRLLASQARFRNPADVEKQWDQESTRMLAVSGAGPDDRIRNLHAAYELAVNNQWIDEARPLLRALACLPAGVREEDIDQVLPAESLSPGRLTPGQAAAELQRNALAFVEAGRLRMLAPLRGHVATNHKAAEAELAGARDFFVGLAEQGGRVGESGGGELLLRIAAEMANTEWAVREKQRRLDPVAAACLGLGEFGRFAGDQRPVVLLKRSAALCRDRGDVRGEANCIQRLGDIALDRSDHEGARGRYEEALRLYRQIPEPYSIGWTLRRLAQLESDLAGRKALLSEIVTQWRSIDREDLIDDLRAEFPGEID